MIDDGSYEVTQSTVKIWDHYWKAVGVHFCCAYLATQKARSHLIHISSPALLLRVSSSVHLLAPLSAEDKAVFLQMVVQCAP